MLFMSLKYSMIFCGKVTINPLEDVVNVSVVQDVAVLENGGVANLLSVGMLKSLNKMLVFTKS